MSTTTVLSQPSSRLLSLDVFRGMTILGMVLVNNPGSWGSRYGPLKHAVWHGWTPTDFVFPFFLFIMGVAMTFSFDKRIGRGDSKGRLFEQVVRRTLILYFLGEIMGAFDDWRLAYPYIGIVVGIGLLYQNPPLFRWGDELQVQQNKLLGWILFGGSTLFLIADFQYFRETGNRVPGVLTRIALCYFFASMIMFYTKLWGRVAWIAVLLLGYWAIMAFVQPPAGYELGQVGVRDAPEGVPYAGALNDWIDIQVLGDHLYRYRPDPEGILSTLPAIATVLCGALLGTFLLTTRSRTEKLKLMLIAAAGALIVGWLWGLAFPINKKIWTSSYVVFMAGWSLLIFAPCYWANDMKGWKIWSKPFEVFGTNAILIFVASGIMARVLGKIRVESGELAADGTAKLVSLKAYLYQNVFEGTFGPGEVASVAYAICFVLVWLAIAAPFHWKRIFLKV